MSRPTLQMFVNPRSGSWYRNQTNTLRRAFEAAGATVIVSESLSGRLEVDGRADHVCVVGGDGTLRHVVAAVRRAGRPVVVSIYPAGTVNLLATECGYPRDPQAFVRRVLHDPAGHALHAGLIGDIPLLTCASVGPDSYAIARLSPRMKRLIGRGAYVLAFCGLLLRWPRTRICLLHDGQRTDCEAVYVAKGRYFAGRWTFAPEASVAEPLFHVLALDKATRLGFLSLAWAFVRGRIERAKGVTRFTCTELAIGGDEALPLQADGDIVTRLPAAVRLQGDPMWFA